MKSIKFLSIAITAMLLLGMGAIIIRPAAAAYPNGRYRVVPSTFSKTTDEIDVGDKFTVNVYADPDMITCISYQFKLYVDSTMLDIVSASLNNTHPDWIFSGLPTVLPSPSIGSDINGLYALVADTTQAGISANLTDPDVALLGSVTFEIIDAPDKYDFLECPLNITNAATFWLGPLVANKHFPIRVNGLYHYEWAQPAAPHLEVRNATGVLKLTYSEFPPTSVGASFDAIIKIMGLSAAWGLTNASLRFIYNATVIDAMGGVANVTFPAHWDDGTSAVFTINPSPAVLDYVDIVVKTTQTLGGDVEICTIKFTVLIQATYPDATVHKSALNIEDEELWDHIAQIIPTAEADGYVNVPALIELPLPTLKVNSITVGPDPVIGEEFNVTVSIVGLHPAWYLVGYNFGLQYDDTLIEPTGVFEGPFLPSFPQVRPPPKTWFFGSFEPDGIFGPHVFVGGLIYPKSGGGWDPPFPSGTGVVAIIEFKVKYQSYPFNNTSPLTLIRDKMINEFLTLIPHLLEDGEFEITTDLPGRMIDLTGGAVNMGYGVPYGTPSAFPAPYGGQGLNGNMDLVIPQSVVYLLAEVTYNYWPTQSKDVGFEIEGPFTHGNLSDPKPGYTYYKYTNRTGEIGTTWIKFQMPWPCEDPESLFGWYKVTATVDICGVIVSDVMIFDYYYLMEITKVTFAKADKQYAHEESITGTIEFKSYAQQPYPVLLFVVAQDELETHFGKWEASTVVSGAQFCSMKTYTAQFSIFIPKHAFAGIGHLYISAFDKNPSVGGAPWGPTFGAPSNFPVFYIEPW